MNKFIAAVAFSAHKHRDQRRRDVSASPYINHPIAVANLLANEADILDAETLLGAILHDTIEDTDTTADELTRVFGVRVSNIVMEVTDDTSLPKAERKRLQIMHAATASMYARRIKIADKTVNLRDVIHNPPPSWSLKRRQDYFDHAKEVVDNMGDVHPDLNALFSAVYAQRPIA